MLVIVIVAMAMGWTMDHSRLVWERDWAVARWEGSYDAFQKSGTAVAQLLGWVEEMRVLLAECESRTAVEDEPSEGEKGSAADP